MKKNLLLILVFFVFGLISCSNDDSSSSDSNTFNYSDLKCIKYASITDANCLFSYGDESSNRAISTGFQKMNGRAAFKTVSLLNNETSSDSMIRKEEIYKIKYLDKNKKVLDFINSDFSPFGTYTIPFRVNIEKIDEKYTVFNYECFAFLVRNSDGKVFIFDNLPQRKIQFCLKTDEIYFLSNTSSKEYSSENYSPEKKSYSFMKAYIDSNDNLIESVLLETDKGDYISEFKVDANGNVIFSKDFYKVYFISNTGKLKYIGAIGHESNFWIGLDGCAYYFLSIRNGSEHIYPLRKIIFNGNEFIETDYGKSGIEFDFYSTIRFYYKDRFLKLKDRIFYIDYQDLYEVYNESYSYRKIELANLKFDKISCKCATENYCFISGIDTSNNLVFVRVDPETDEYIRILPDNSWEIYSFVVSETNGITFNGMNMDNGKIITAKVSIDGGDVYPLDEDSDEKIYGLTQIR